MYTSRCISVTHSLSLSLPLPLSLSLSLSLSYSLSLTLSLPLPFPLSLPFVRLWRKLVTVTLGLALSRSTLCLTSTVIPMVGLREASLGLRDLTTAPWELTGALDARLVVVCVEVHVLSYTKTPWELSN